MCTATRTCTCMRVAATPQDSKFSRPFMNCFSMDGKAMNKFTKVFMPKHEVSEVVAVF